MKRLLQAAPLIPAVLVLSACAHNASTERHAFEVRSDYVAAVDRTATQRGVTVIWVNPPMRGQPRDLEWSSQVEVDINRNPGE